MEWLRNADLIISDWSGVISNDMRPVHEANARMSKRFGLEPIPFENWFAHTTASPREYFLKHGVDLSEDELFEIYVETFTEVLKDGIRPYIYLDARMFLHLHSNRYRFAVVSGHPEPFLHHEVKVYGISRYLRPVIGSSRIKANDIERVLKTHGVAKEKAVYMGDMISDVRSAKAAGIRCIALTRGYHEEQRLAAEEPDLIAHTLADVHPHMR